MGWVGRNPLARHGQARFGVDRLVAHQAHEAAHALFVDSVAGQAQVVAQAQHALKIMLRELLIEQAHEFQVVNAFPAGIVIKAAAGQAQGLTASYNRTTGRGWGLDQGALLGRAHRGSVFFSSAFSICNRPMAA